MDIPPACLREFPGKEKKIGLLGKSIAMGGGTSFAEPIVARLINEETLVDLLSKGDGGGGLKVRSELAPFSESALKSAPSPRQLPIQPFLKALRFDSRAKCTSR
jgi:hypothetical protein